MADLSETFSKGDRTNWSYKIYEITETISDTKPSYRIDNSKERYNESLLKKTEGTLKKKMFWKKWTSLRSNQIDVDRHLV